MGLDSPLRFADMFCGIGGFHVAAAQLGMHCVFACDIDPEARRAYCHNFGVEPAGDIMEIRPDSIPDHDILMAGFPCQPFSIIGAMRGFDDARGTLFFNLAETIEAKRPSALLLENVRQLSTHNKGRTLVRIIEVLERTGLSDGLESSERTRFWVGAEAGEDVHSGILGSLGSVRLA